MEEFSALKGSIDRFGERIGKLEQKMVVNEERYGHMNTLIKQNVTVLEKLDVTLQDNRIAMERLSSAIEANRGDISELHDEISHIEQEVDDLKGERNFNIVQWFKNNFVSIIVGAALLYYIIMK